MHKRPHLSFFVVIVLAAACFTSSQAMAATPQISAGYYHNVVLAVDGTVWTWGRNGSGQLCDSTRPTPDYTPRPIPGLDNVAYVAAGSDFTLLVKEDGTVWSCGDNDSGQLGRGYTNDNERDIGIVVNDTGADHLTGVIAVAAGNDHSLALRDDGTVWGWGTNYGKLGTDQDINDPHYHPICGGPYCNKPVQATAITNATAIAAGLYHSMAITGDAGEGGEVWTWGSNNSWGQLGRPGNAYIPAKIPDLTGITAIAAGWEHSLAVTSIASGGNLYGWGKNTEYQSLVSDSSIKYLSRYYPQANSTQQTPALILSHPPDPDGYFILKNISPPAPLTGIISAAASQAHSVLITSNGGMNSVIGWGQNHSDSETFTDDNTGGEGQILLFDFRGVLGIGNENNYAYSPYSSVLRDYNSNYPPALPLWNSGSKGIVSIKTGRQHTLALRDDGTIYTSGVNSQFQLGKSSGAFISTPATVQLTNMTCSTNGAVFSFNINTPPLDCDFDNDGVFYTDDKCPGYDDNIDTNNNQIPDDCEELCTGDSSTGDTDSDGICNDQDPDDDNDGVIDGSDAAPTNPAICQDIDSDGCNDCSVGVDGFGPESDVLPGNDGLDSDGDGICDAGDPCPFGQDSDGDAICDVDDSCPEDYENDIDQDGICAGAEFASPKTGANDNCPYDADNDIDNDNICGDVDPCPDDPNNDWDNDGICAGTLYNSPKSGAEDNCPEFANSSQENYDSPYDTLGDFCDDDDDNDGVIDTLDISVFDPTKCADIDNDGCDDCSVGVDGLGIENDFNSRNDGDDFDSDGICDAGDLDRDNDGVLDADDSNPLNPLVCADADGDSCDDCAVTGDDNSGGDIANDGSDYDNDGICDAGQPDDDNDGVLDGDDSNPLNEFVCADIDGDSCDDCAVTGADGSGGDIDNDGDDYDNDGTCDAGQSDDDNDGVLDDDDSNPLNEFVCADIDGDSCDDCAVTGADGSGGDIANDGPDYDNDGTCDAGQPDDDNDGVLDGDDSNPLNEFVCADIDGDSCDDCAVTGADGSGGDIDNDGDDYDNDGTCDAGQPDDDNDGVLDGDDSNPLDPLVCSDTDSDSCDDCAVTGADGSGGNVFNDGIDYDNDGICDAGDLDRDNDGVPDTSDNDLENEFVCADTDNDSCDDCAVTGGNGSGGDINNDGLDSDGDGACDVGDSYANDPNLVYPGISEVVLPPESNIDQSTENPKADTDFPFKVTVDADNAASVWLVINDQPIEMDCGNNPNFTDPLGVQCTTSLKLGPAPNYNYRYEVWDSADRSGTILVSSLEIAGPDIHLLNGPNMVGLPKDISASSADFLSNMGSNSVFSWHSTGLRDTHNKGYFVAHDNTHVHTPGQGYFMIGEAENQTLPASLQTDPNIVSITTPTVSIDLQPGWNLISNPYPATILLDNLMIQKNDAAAITWANAAATNLVFNGIYYFKGSDWGSQYAFESAGGVRNATLTPWLGYWIYLKVDDAATYKLIFYKP